MSEPLRVMVVDDHPMWRDAVKAGATGYLVESASRQQLLDAVRRVAAGGTVLPPGLAGLVLGEFRRLADGPERGADGGPARG